MNFYELYMYVFTQTNFKEYLYGIKRATSNTCQSAADKNALPNHILVAETSQIMVLCDVHS